ncbi:MAG TPA: Sir2 family NAD-dependent protein deacetylase [Candidatus Binataceae bacterium]|nr:Sir2 family NAD-dependent protein deacetylase [Candidatus Binataceae bacterium]
MSEHGAAASELQILEAADLILEADYAIALTGAGMSVESGIPPFRGPGGLWTKYGEPPMNGFQIFMADPKRAWEQRLARQNDELYAPLRAAQPNPGHLAMVELETLGVLQFVITQNIDDLHRQAGQHQLAEIHGNWTLIRCLGCGSRSRWAEVNLEQLPPHCTGCGGLLKSDTVAFGEPIPADVMALCTERAALADLVIVAGTSATVYPAAGFALQIKERGGRLIEVNLYESDLTPLCDVSLRGGAASVMPKLARAVATKRRAALS